MKGGKDNLAYEQANSIEWNLQEGKFEEMRLDSVAANETEYLAYLDVMGDIWEKGGEYEVNNISLRTLALVKLESSLERKGVRLNQLESIKALMKKLRDKNWNMSGYLVQPTGAGKTVLFGLIAAALDLKTVILVPKTNLLEQTRDELVEVVGLEAEKIGLVGNGLTEFDKQIVVSTYQSHVANWKKDPQGFRKRMAEVRLLICDEAHRSLGDITQEALQIENQEEKRTESEMGEVMTDLQRCFGDEVMKLAFTATPKLAQKSVREVFGEVEICRESYANLVRAGVLVPFKLHHTEGKIVLGEDVKADMPMTLDEEAKVLEKEQTYQKLLEMFANIYFEKDEKLRTAVFCSSIAECDKFMDLAKSEYGFKCIRVTSKDDAEALAIAEKGLLDGTIDLVVTVDKLTEGWNFPPLNAVINARATNSPARLLQGAGRSCRAYMDKKFAHIFETNWLVSSKAGNTDELGGENEFIGERGEGEPGEGVVKRAQNLLEALLKNGEKIEDLCLICKDSLGVDYVYESAEMKEREMLVGVMKKLYTAEEWAGLSHKQRQKMKIGGLGLKALARKFGVEGDPINHTKYHLELGRKIYGEECKCLQFEDKLELSMEELKKAVLKECATAEEWVNLSKKQKNAVKIGGLGLVALARKFGVEGDPINHTKYHLELGRKIYGEECKCLQFEDKLELSMEELKKAVLKECATAEEWVNLSKKQKNAVKIGGLGLVALATKFEVEGNPINYTRYYLELGRKIYGEECKCLQFEDKLELSMEELKKAVLKECATAEEWVNLSKKQKNAVKIGGLGLIALARKFGVEGNPIGHTKYHLELGRKIYGEECKCLQFETVEELKKAVLKECATAEEWVNLSKKQKNAVKIGGLGLKALARKFEVEGDPINHTKYHLELGRKIYGEECKCLQFEDKLELSMEELKKAVLKECATAEEWAGLSSKQKNAVKIGGLGLIALARKFGVEGNPIGHTKYHLELGRKIYGEECKCLQFEDKLELSMEELKKAVLKECATAEEWAGLSSKQKNAVKIGGLGLIALARKFGVEGNPINHARYHLELGRKIYGEECKCLKQK